MHFLLLGSLLFEFVRVYYDELIIETERRVSEDYCIIAIHWRWQRLTNIKKIFHFRLRGGKIVKWNGKCYFSQAILADKTLYVSGVLGMDPEAQLVCGGAEAQTKQALENLRHVLEAGGASLESVVKTTILLANMNDFQVVNQVYAECRYQSVEKNKNLHL